MGETVTAAVRTRKEPPLVSLMEENDVNSYAPTVLSFLHNFLKSGVASSSVADPGGFLGFRGTPLFVVLHTSAVENVLDSGTPL